ncbi:limonene-1,2-epoxide hydrolase [Mycolicibacter terrae]|jgi:limonene-1,2-epoxide hydrolase|uniref:Limonene-1,2-epoxide hydrolase n=1 Tax=Mycolicibacter terrae TaxID=1788 RepID=A0AAD1HWY7_9MYCO|nr:limonene-1,2-epoxide hydrolase family protein [Mycolicibacter terrae]ORW94095.1 limonene-1,2-epoxide hydrolase [Mycolicibacter terrae]BBX22206.1 limonene-1,2-epoxide hydrolase [Mycolicibacter terrae]SNV77611.1 limonene-1,2-epoxide hydrolase [Mycolicibacter terrae]
MTEPSVQQIEAAANIRTVETFLDALADDDHDAAATVLAEDVVYQNVGLPTIYGRSATIGLFRRMAGRAAFDVKIHRIAADGAAVLTERTDALTLGPLRLQFWVCGVFEVHNGRITLWRDYFDFLDMFKATLRAIAATVFPALRPTM